MTLWSRAVLDEYAGHGRYSAVKQYDPGAPLFSLHVPKCGGTSLRAALEGWFGRRRVIQHYPGEGLLPGPDTAKPGTCVHGHFNRLRGHGVMEKFPQASQFITFLREPFDRYLSFWFFTEARKPGAGDFGRALRRRARAHAERKYAHSFVWQMPQDDQIGLPIAERFARDFVFVGLMERYQPSLDALAAALGKPRAELPHVNATPRTGDFEEWRPFYREHFADEYAIYEAAVACNDELLRMYADTPPVAKKSGWMARIFSPAP